jgi:hypothetical protein
MLNADRESGGSKWLDVLNNGAAGNYRATVCAVVIAALVNLTTHVAEIRTNAFLYSDAMNQLASAACRTTNARPLNS